MNENNRSNGKDALTMSLGVSVLIFLAVSLRFLCEWQNRQTWRLGSTIYDKFSLNINI